MSGILTELLAIKPILPFIWFAANKVAVAVLISALAWMDHQSPLKNGRNTLAELLELSPSAGMNFKVP